jgi:hypothetical protein
MWNKAAISKNFNVLFKSNRFGHKLRFMSFGPSLKYNDKKIPIQNSLTRFRTTKELGSNLGIPLSSIFIL